jgi:hypothetical protein
VTSRGHREALDLPILIRPTSTPSISTLYERNRSAKAGGRTSVMLARSVIAVSRGSTVSFGTTPRMPASGVGRRWARLGRGWAARGRETRVTGENYCAVFSHVRPRVTGQVRAAYGLPR